MTLVPDVTGEGEVCCPCGGGYCCSVALFVEVGWPMRQVVCPSCGNIIEPLVES